MKESPAVNLRETVISSFFFHLILFLLMLAVSDFTTHISGDMQKFISVDLATENSSVLPAAPQETKDSQPPDIIAPSDKQMSLPDRNTISPPEEKKDVRQAEKKADPTPEPAKVEETEKPSAPAAKSPSLEEYIQFVILHKNIFRQQAGSRVNELLGEALKVNKREFYGGTGVVSLQFGADGKLSNVVVDSTSAELKSFLEEISWSTIPSPAAYSLRHTGVQIEFSVREGYMDFKIDTL